MSLSLVYKLIELCKSQMWIYWYHCFINCLNYTGPMVEYVAITVILIAWIMQVPKVNRGCQVRMELTVSKVIHWHIIYKSKTITITIIYSLMLLLLLLLLFSNYDSGFIIWFCFPLLRQQAFRFPGYLEMLWILSLVYVRSPELRIAHCSECSFVKYVEVQRRQVLHATNLNTN